MNNISLTIEELSAENEFLKERIRYLESAYPGFPKINQPINISEDYKSLGNILTLMCNDLPDMIWVKDLDNNYIFTNKALCNKLLMAKSTDEPIGKSESFFVEREKALHPANANWYTFGEISEESDSRVMNSKKLERFEEFGNVKGEYLFLDIYKAPLVDDLGNIIGTIGCARDNTNEKKLERECKLAKLALTEIEDQYRVTLKAIPDLMFRINLAGVFVDFHANNTGELALPKEKIIGANIKDIFNSDLSEKILGLVKLCIESGNNEVLEYSMNLAGKTNFYESHIVKAGQNEVLAVVRNITTRKKTEITLENERDEMLYLFDSLSELIYVADLNSHEILYTNPFTQRLVKSEAIGKKCYKILYGFDLPCKFCTNAKIKELNGEPYQWEFHNHLLGKDYLITDKIIRWPNGKDVRFEIAIDISHRKNAEKEIIIAKEKAEDMNRLKNSFLANMSHELRTPLIGVMGFAELLSTELVDPELKMRADMIHESGQRLLETLNLVLDLSIIEANKLELELKKVNVSQIVQESIEKFQEYARKKNLYLRTTIKNEMLFAYLDAKIFLQVLSNLLNNAIKYTETGGINLEIVKENYEGNEFAVIRVIDTGIGIPPQSMDIIFEPFRQVSEGYNRKFDGSGLGLTITKKFVQSMNGSIDVESKVGIGSIFKISFPIIVSKPDSLGPIKIVKQKQQPAEISNIAKRRSIPALLFVEDDEINRSVVKLFLKDSYHLDFTSTGENSIEMAQKKKYSAILMDINLAGKMNGLEAAKEIRKLNGYQDIPIIAITACAMVGDRERILNEGCTHYLSKPFSKDKIVKLVDKVLD
ncbi:MAG: ATP-binding protein [Ignavibacteriales bacterium]|nr:ATP-binding protein [Ignavibacteriales bacterium]